MDENITINRKYKDRLFCFIFGGKHGKEYPLSLYNAVNNTNYTNAEDLEITTLEDAVFMHMKNDVSFLFDDKMSFLEQQSTVCGNLALRNFLYCGKVYSAYTGRFGSDIYGQKLLMIPTPECITFYNGMHEQPAIEYQHLSDSFIRSRGDNNYEWTVKVINLNHPDNKSMVEQSKPLMDYVEFVARIQEKLRRRVDIVTAVVNTVESCISDGIMSDLLRRYKDEMIASCLTEFDEEGFKEVMRREGYEEGVEVGRKQGIEQGRKQGIEQGRKQGIEQGKKQGLEQGKKQTFLDLLRKNIITISVASKELGMDEEEINKLL